MRIPEELRCMAEWVQAGLNSGERWIVWVSFQYLFTMGKQASDVILGVLALIATGLKVMIQTLRLTATRIRGRLPHTCGRTRLSFVEATKWRIGTNARDTIVNFDLQSDLESRYDISVQRGIRNTTKGAGMVRFSGQWFLKHPERGRPADIRIVPSRLREPRNGISFGMSSLLLSGPTFPPF